MRVSIASTFMGIAVLTCSGLLGQVGEALSNLIAVIAAAALLFLGLFPNMSDASPDARLDRAKGQLKLHLKLSPMRNKRAIFLSVLLVLFFALLYLRIPANLVWVRLLVLALYCTAIGLSQKRNDNTLSSLCWILSLTTFLFALFALALFELPAFRQMMQSFSVWLSSVIARSIGLPVLLNPSASGIFVSLFMLTLGLVFTLVAVRRRLLAFGVYSVAILACNVVFIAFLHPVHNLFQQVITIPQFHIMDLPLVLFFSDIVVLHFYSKNVELNRVDYRFSEIGWTHAVGEGLLSAGLLSILFLNHIRYFESFKAPPQTRGEKKQILLYAKGYLNWDKPEFGRYGIQSSGMFGMFPAYLSALGYHVLIDSTIDNETLNRTDAVVLVNLDSPISNDEKKALRRFVSDGGGLLVMGDHTGLGGIMQPLNDAIDFTGIRFRFDCAHWFTGGWKDSFEFTSHPILYEVNDETDIEISIGASLDLASSAAAPVLLARYGFSDNGNLLNDRNAFLGDRTYNAGELAGDVVLVASEQCGKGKVLVFGDTSPFQNGSLAYSFGFIWNVFRWLTSPGLSVDYWKWASLFSIALGLMFLLVFGNGIKKTSGLMVSLIIVVGIGMLLIPSNHSTDNIRDIDPCTAFVYLDASHLNRFSRFGDDGIWPLTYNLMRNEYEVYGPEASTVADTSVRYLPIACRKFSPGFLTKSRIAFFVAPGKTFSPGEMNAIESFMLRGGIVVWSVGNEEKEASLHILHAQGLGIDNIPLGHASGSATSARQILYAGGSKPSTVNDKETSDILEERPQFHSAWPILHTTNVRLETLCTGWEFPIVVSKRVGKGKFVLVSDSGFFLNDNLESASGKSTSNIGIFSALLKAITRE